MRITTAGRLAAITGGIALVAGSTLAVTGPAFSAQNTIIQVTADEIAPTPATHVGWHEGFEPPAQPASVTAEGLNLAGASQIINGLSTVRHVDGTSQTLGSVVGGIGFSSSYDAVHYQLEILTNAGSDGTDGEAGTGETTLRPAIPGLAGLTGYWVSSEEFGGGFPSTEQSIVDDADAASDSDAAPAASEGNPTASITSTDQPRLAAAPPTIEADTLYSIAELDAALGSFDIIGFGVLAADGIVDTVQTIDFAGTTYRFDFVAAEPEATEVPATTVPTPTSTSATTATDVKKLSNTGADTTPLLIGGAILLIGGAAAMVFGSKARRKQA